MANEARDQNPDEREDQKSHIVYGLDERPPPIRTVVYAFQHIFAMILGSITGGVIIGQTVGLDDAQTGQLIGYINFAVGIATILQVRYGVRLPIIQGSTMGHVPAYLALGSVGVAIYQDPVVTMQYLGGALLVGALLEAAVGGLNLLRYVFRFISPLTVGIVIMMVGLGLWRVVADFIGGAWVWAMGVIVLVLIGNFAFGVTVKTMAIFGAVIIAYLAAVGGTLAGWFPSDHAMHVDFTPIVGADWLTLPGLFPWGWPQFSWGFILAMTLPYIATAFESMGDYIAVSNSIQNKNPSIKRISRGILTEGIASTLSSSLGGTASSSFSQNVGVVRLSGVASLFVCIVAGILLIAIGLFGKMGAVFSSIPRVVLGAVYLMAFGILVLTGLRLVLKAKVTAARNEAIIGSALLLGLALPGYMEDNQIAFENASLQVFVNVFLATPMMVAGVWVFILDNIIPGTDEERGIQGWISAVDDEDEESSQNKESG